MAAFEAMCEGYLGISAHCHLFRYFFMFACLKEGSRAATIDCANLRMKKGWDDNYILVSLTSSNNGWQKGWFYLRYDPEFALRRTPEIPLASRGGTIQTAPRRRSKRRSSRITGQC
jgi:hypothetical protein